MAEPTIVAEGQVQYFCTCTGVPSPFFPFFPSPVESAARSLYLYVYTCTRTRTRSSWPMSLPSQMDRPLPPPAFRKGAGPVAFQGSHWPQRDPRNKLKPSGRTPQSSRLTPVVHRTPPSLPQTRSRLQRKERTCNQQACRPVSHSDACRSCAPLNYTSMTVPLSRIGTYSSTSVL